MNKITYQVPDMSCAHCKAKIEGEVNKLNGVQEANADVDKKRLMVTFDENTVQSENIEEAVSEAGYTAEKE
ncbi:MAG: copper ion binding protein [Tetragenococcus sp.]|nr:copper ion binding protein [Tetragenococcus sp.]